jgi:Fic family protein
MKNIGNSQFITAFAPFMPGDRSKKQLYDLATELLTRSSALAAKLHPIVQESVGQLVASMNCYYSNLIEGHDTHPRDIGRALAEDFSNDHTQRALQREAKAHIEVQECIDNNNMPFPVISRDFICWIHQEFCRRLPEELLWVTNPDNNERIPVIPGKLRTSWVKVGKHVPPAAESLIFLLQQFESAYQLTQQPKIEHIIMAAASHHRLLWIHPFFDGNGRVARLFSHAVLSAIGVGSRLWSIARGFACHNDAYKTHLGYADALQQARDDGEVILSDTGLEQFCEFFIKTGIEQIVYMDKLLDPANLSRHIEYYVAREQLPNGSWPLLREALLCGEFERGKAATITGYKERQARTVLNHLVKKGLLVSKTVKSPVRLSFPTDVIEQWFPRLYPMGV